MPCLHCCYCGCKHNLRVVLRLPHLAAWQAARVGAAASPADLGCTRVQLVFLLKAGLQYVHAVGCFLLCCVGHVSHMWLVLKF
jgi:hypothetical protein